MCFRGGGSFCLLSLFESRQNAGFRPELVVSAESHVVDHGFEVAVEAEDHAPLVEFAFGAAARDLHAPLGTDIGLAAQLHRTVLDHDLRPDEGHVRVPFLVEICIDHDPHDGPGVGVEREFAVGVGLVLVGSGAVTFRKAAIRELGRDVRADSSVGEHRQISVLAALPALPADGAWTGSGGRQHIGKNGTERAPCFKIACSHPRDAAFAAEFLLFLNHLVPASIENCSVLPGGKVESLVLVRHLPGLVVAFRRLFEAHRVS